MEWCNSNFATGKTQNDPAVLLPWQQFCFRVYFMFGWHSHFFSESDIIWSHEQVRRRKAIWVLRTFQVGLSASPHRVKNGDILFITERDWGREKYHGNVIMGVSLFLTWLTLLVPRLSSITPILPEISLILLFIFVQKLFVTSSIFEQKLEYLWNERRYSKEEHAI